MSEISGEAIACAEALTKASQYPVQILNGGFQRFSASYPFFRTQKILYTVKVIIPLNITCKSVKSLENRNWPPQCADTLCVQLCEQGVESKVSKVKRFMAKPCKDLTTRQSEGFAEAACGIGGRWLVAVYSHDPLHCFHSPWIAFIV